MTSVTVMFEPHKTIVIFLHFVEIKKNHSRYCVAFQFFYTVRCVKLVVCCCRLFVSVNVAILTMSHWTNIWSHTDRESLTITEKSLKIKVTPERQMGNGQHLPVPLGLFYKCIWKETIYVYWVFRVWNQQCMLKTGKHTHLVALTNQTHTDDHFVYKMVHHWDGHTLAKEHQSIIAVIGLRHFHVIKIETSSVTKHSWHSIVTYRTYCCITFLRNAVYMSTTQCILMAKHCNHWLSMSSSNMHVIEYNMACPLNILNFCFKTP